MRNDSELPPGRPAACVNTGRRRVLALIAASSVALLTPSRGRAAAPALRWRGRLLGAPADIALYHADRAAAQAALVALDAEIARLVAIFSLEDEASALAQLNRTASLPEAPTELLDVLACCRALHARSDGAFDPTVQPLWELYRRHFAAADASPAGPAEAAIAGAQARVGLQHVRVEGRRLAFARDGLALTLNGIAQGYVTDRARALLAAHGMPHALINLGEYAALGPRPDGTAWRLALVHPDIPWRTLGDVELAADMALATSAPGGTPLDASGRFHHLFDPRTGHCRASWRSVTVCAPNAMLADGLSTALAVAPAAAAAHLLAAHPRTGALLLDEDDHLHALGARLSIT